MSEDKFGITNYAKASDPAELQKMEDLLAKDPESVPLLEWIAFMYYTSESPERAIELYSKLVELDGKNEAHHYYLANLFLRKNRKAEAVEHWKAVITLNPVSKFADKAKHLIEENS